MKKTLLLIISLICITSLSAQQPGLNTYILHFTDKGINKNSAINPSIYLSDKSVERRLKRKIAFDQADIPVNDQYVQEISKTGARIMARSRWFNTVVIEANAAMVDQIKALPFISKAQQLTSGAKQPLTSTSEKPFWENETMSPWIGGISKNVLADKYNYGAAYNQISQLNGQYLHNMGYSGQGMTIAVIDAGFNSVDVMTCFDSLRSNNQIKGTHDFAQPSNNVYATTMNSHGTMVLSCMGANSSGKMVGTAPKADYWLLRSEVGATESIIEEYYWVSAAEFADSVGADLINSSLGYTTFDNPASNHTYADMDGNTTVITKGADKAAEKGILVVNSAGNSGSSAWKYIGAPADGDSVFTIGAVNASGIKASFSSVGPTSDGRIKPTVSAQGEGSAVFASGGQGSANGTSFSSPIICGITACLWQAMSDLNNMQIIETIKVTASQSSQPDELLGWGIPDYQLAFTTLSVADKAVQKTLVTYPNPVNDKLTVGFPMPVQGKYRFEIVNLQGKVVYSRERNEGSIRSIQAENLGNIPSGIYFIKVTTGSIIFSGKIIKM
jgi:serine protease AprX